MKYNKTIIIAIKQLTFIKNKKAALLLNCFYIVFLFQN